MNPGLLMLVVLPEFCEIGNFKIPVKLIRTGGRSNAIIPSKAIASSYERGEYIF